MKRILITLCLVSCFASIAIADDLIPPLWAANADTYQVWEFGSDPGGNTVLPDIDQNPYGTPTITFGGVGTSWQPQGGDPSYNVDLKQGVLQAAMPGDYIDIFIPNQQDLTKHKVISIQITFTALHPGDPSADIFSVITPSYTDSTVGTVTRAQHPGGGDIYQLVPVTSVGGTGNNWFQLAEEWIIDPQPDSEMFHIEVKDTWPAGAPLWVDEVVVHTQCVPEPVTMGLLAIGGLAVIRRKK